MDWTQTITIIGVFIGGFFFLMTRIDSNKKDTDYKLEGINNRLNGIENRLTAVEVEIKNTNQRLSNIENCVMPRKVLSFEAPHKEDPEEPKEN